MKNILRFVQTFLILNLITIRVGFTENMKMLNIDEVFQINIEQTINPATLSHLRHAIKKMNNCTECALLIQINTPGGLVSVTKSMITEIGQANVPFIALVGPEGGSATSAGAILSAASHLLFMRPGTNIGAATPITMNAEMPKDARNKAINDLVALVTSLREARNKEAAPFKEMITEAKSFSAEQAFKLKIADGILPAATNLKNFLTNKVINFNGKNYTLNGVMKISIIEMDLGQKILNFLASPELSYILFLLGAALIYFELQAPGGFIAGGLGVILLILAGVSFQVIPLNMGAFGLIILSFLLFFLEIYVTSFGILSLAGLASLVTGSLFLFRTDDAYFELSKGVIISTTSAVVTFMGLIFYIFMKSRKQLSSNFNDDLPKSGEVIKVLEKIENKFHYQIKTQGAIWRASSTFEFHKGEMVAIEKKDSDNMAYIIKPLN